MNTKNNIKSPFTGGKVTLKTREEEITFRGEKLKVDRPYYLCEDTGREFTSDELDEDMMWAIARAYCEKKGIKSFCDILPDIELIKRSWYQEGYIDRDNGMEPMWITKPRKGGPIVERNPKYGQHLQQSWPPQDYTPTVATTKIVEIPPEFPQISDVVDKYLVDNYTDDDQNPIPFKERMFSHDRDDLIRFAKYIAAWQKEQMMKEVVDADVNTYEELPSGMSYVEFVADIPASRFKKRNKVKLVIIK